MRQTQPAECATSRPPLPLFHTITIVHTNADIYVSGEVARPARFDWAIGLTLTNAIQLTGGFTDFADRARIELRRVDGTVERYSLCAYRKWVYQQSLTEGERPRNRETEVFEVTVPPQCGGAPLVRSTAAAVRERLVRSIEPPPCFSTRCRAAIGTRLSRSTLFGSGGRST